MLEWLASWKLQVVLDPCTSFKCHPVTFSVLLSCRTMNRFSVSIFQSVNSLTVQEEHSLISMNTSRENVFRGNGVRAENIEVRGLELFLAGRRFL